MTRISDEEIARMRRECWIGPLLDAAHYAADVTALLAEREALLAVVEAAQAYLENDGMGPDATPEEYLASCVAEAELHAALEALRKETP